MNATASPRMSLDQAASASGGRLVNGGDRGGHLLAGVSTDSRTLAPGELFVAIAGENFDGHDHLDAARLRGAAAALVSREVMGTSLPQIIVDDTLIALGRLGRDWRNRFNIPVIALTGSNGKTTVKEMLRSILAAYAGNETAVLATEGNLNNHIGVPLMLLRLNVGHRYAVIEMGMNHLQEIDYLSRLATPDVALIIMAGTAHIGELGSREAIAQAKGEILAGLAGNGIAVINLHDRFGEYWRGLAGSRRVIGFGVLPGDDVVGELAQDALTIRHAGKAVKVQLHVAGEHNQRNALAAAAAAIAVGVPLAIIARGLEDFEGVAGRLRNYQGHGHATIIDDTYNANPDSVRAAIDVLKMRPGKRLLVLGDMGELGAAANEMHGEIGLYAKHANLEGVFAIGKLTEATIMAMGASGWHFNSIDELVDEVLPQLGPNATVLVKGSRFMKMERVVARLVPDYHGAPH
jgi:UDP-N-acetylmuramoyl-tripeptide--D-alanyl-D-alanine ligase